LYIDDEKNRRINRFLFLLEREDYDGALSTLESASVLPFSTEEEASHLLLKRLLVVLKMYRERMALLEEHGPFDDIILSYLNEDYGTTLRKVRVMKEEDYIRPLLSGIETGLHTNMEIERQIEENLELREKVTRLAGKAAQLEENGEYGKAVDAFESLLFLPLPSYDREHALNRVHSLWLEVELKRVKREENTKAIKYLESARILNREGNEKGAIEYYRMLLIECPHSDFVGDAVDEILKLRTM
jgi:tetratricopeptide (TPR) repeat protein